MRPRGIKKPQSPWKLNLKFKCWGDGAAKWKKKEVDNFDKAKMSANAAAAVGKVKAVSASDELLHTIITDNLFNKLKSYFAEEKKTEKRFIGELNKAQSENELPQTSAGKKSRSKQVSAKRSAPVASEVPSPVDQSLESSDDSEEDDLAEFPQLIQADLDEASSDSEPEDYICDFCRQRREHMPELACHTCETFFLCNKCARDGKALAKHFKETICGKDDRPRTRGGAQK